MGKNLDLDDVVADHPLAKDQLAELRLAARRYETARRMAPAYWASAWEHALKTGRPFDEIIDTMRQVMFPNG